MHQFTPWIVAVLLVSPWLAPLVWVRGQLRDREVPPSMAEMARERLWQS